MQRVVIMQSIFRTGALTALLTVCLGIFAQPDSASSAGFELIRQQSVLIRTGIDSILALNQGTGPAQFSNLYRLPYYVDKRELSRLRTLEARGAQREWAAGLESYIARFGIQNFATDNNLLWLAGSVFQALKDTSKALYYYELAALHKKVPEFPTLAFDSLRAVTSSEWIPVERYYELIEFRQLIDPMTPSRKFLTSMGKMINSTAADYAPFMHPTDSLLIFTSRRDTTGLQLADVVDPWLQQNEDLYYSVKDFITGQWDLARRLPSSINTLRNEGSACLAPDGKTLFFTRCNDRGGTGDCDIYVAEYDPAKDEWISIRNLGGAINSEFWDSQPNISADGKALFFSSNRKGGFGGTDIYYCLQTPAGGWTEARNMGPIINTARDEVTPFFHKINRTLYFSSNGHLKNFGGFDILKSRWVGGNWEPVKNLGPLINTDGNEYYFSIDSDGETIFYANSRNPDQDHVKQDFDLFSFPMPMEARPDAIAGLRGFLIDSVSGNPLTGTIMILDMEQGIEIAPKQIGENGYFEFDLRDNNRYRIFVIGDGFLTIKNDFEMRGDTTFQMVAKSLEEGKPIVFQSLEFTTNSTKLKAKNVAELDYLARFLQTYPMFRLSVEGHTDSDGKPSYNLELSRRRSQAIANYLIATGSLDPGRVTAKGFGDTRPLVPNDSEENKTKNRRVEFKLEFDPTYEGDAPLPTWDELFFKKKAPQPGDDDEFDMPESFGKEFEPDEPLDDDLDLDEELKRMETPPAPKKP